MSKLKLFDKRDYEKIRLWLQQKPFPNYNDAKYALPDGWTFEDQKDAMEIYIGDVFKWKKELLEELE